MMAGTIPKATVEDLRTANKTLRFAKETQQVTMKFPSIVGANYGFIALSDAAWGTPLDGSSQGGYLVLAVPVNAFKDEAFEYAIVDWRSWKLKRVSRSSLDAETQAAATATDALEFTQTFFHLMRFPETPVKEAASKAGRPSCLVVDAKSLYDAVRKEAPVE